MKMKMKTMNLTILLTIGTIVSFNVFSSENLDLMRCMHTVDGVTIDEGAITLENGDTAGTALEKCTTRVDQKHVKNLSEIYRVHSTSLSVHCEVAVNGGIGSGPFN
jgi:regulatory protein YycH of two-component signal transduction system YycFG